MLSDSHRTYLETQVMTATPQKLRLMLIEGALRFARETLANWEQEQREEGIDATIRRRENAAESLARCREVVIELLSSVRADDSEVARKVADVYMFLFRTLAEASLHRRPEKVREAVRVLELERDTWRKLCEQMPDFADADSLRPATEVTADSNDAIAPVPPPHAAVDPPPGRCIFEGGLSLEA